MSNQKLYCLSLLMMTLQLIYADDFNHYSYPVAHIRSLAASDHQPIFDTTVQAQNNGSPTTGWYISTSGPTSEIQHAASPYQVHASSRGRHQEVTNSQGISALQKNEKHPINLSDPVVVAVLTAQLGNERFQALVSAVHQQKYGVTYDFLWGNKYKDGLYLTRDYEKVASWILHASDLTKEQALAVWQGYCNKRIVGGDKKVNGRRLIVAEYDRRIERENKRLHDLARAQKDADEKIKSECIARAVKLKAQEEQEAFAKKQQTVDPVRFINQK